LNEGLADYSKTRHHNFSVSGGTSNVRYYGSFGTQRDDGININSKTSYDRYNLRANIDYTINDYLSLGLDISGSQENRMYPSFTTNSIWFMLLRGYPTEHATYPNGLPGPDIENGLHGIVSASDASGFDDDKRYRSNNILSASLKIPGVEGLSLSGYYAYDLYFQNRKLFQTPYTLYQLDRASYLAAGNTGREDGSDFLIGTLKAYPEPRLTDYSNNSQRNTINVKLDYSNSFNGAHNINAFVAYEQHEFDEHGIEAFRRYYVSTLLPYLFAGGDAAKDNTSTVGLDASKNYFGRLSYDYQGLYMFQFSFRRDGSIRFSEEAGRWGNFPSVLVGWRPSQYDWWRNNLYFIDYFKLKASYGQMGNDLVSAFQYLASYGFGLGTIFGE
jgi:TonB-dependent starch-binding outer membrane protein SusC